MEILWLHATKLQMMVHFVLNKTQLSYPIKLSSVKIWKEDLLLIYDKTLLKTKAKSFIKKFKYRYAVQAGESLKDVNALPLHLLKIQKIVDSSPKKLGFISLGGGSVGDFVGFVASIYHRGVPLVHMPSTWLSAIDSAHGGKTALNLAGTKNQIGTFYQASKVIICKEILSSQPEHLAIDAGAEAFKIALLNKKIWNRISKKNLTAETMWSVLPYLVNAKYQIVSKDPQEKTGLRQILNLGHTVGHVIESSLGWTHGKSIWFGLSYALSLSRKKSYLSEKSYLKIIASNFSEPLPSEPELRKVLRSIKTPQNFLLRDKKRSGTLSLHFIFLEQIGRPCRVKISISDLLQDLRDF